MKKEDLLKIIAESGYNIGFGAKVHFATYDIVEKVPGFIGYLSLTVGILSLVNDFFSSSHLTATLIILGITSILINLHSKDSEKYKGKGIQLTGLFNDLKDMYYNAKDTDQKAKLDKYEKELNQINETYNSISISKQILFSHWYAHYKFFWQHQIEWIDEQKKFQLFRDKIPLSGSLVAISIIVLIIIFLLLKIVKLKCGLSWHFA